MHTPLSTARLEALSGVLKFVVHVRPRFLNYFCNFRWTSKARGCHSEVHGRGGSTCRRGMLATLCCCLLLLLHLLLLLFLIKSSSPTSQKCSTLPLLFQLTLKAFVAAVVFCDVFLLNLVVSVDVFSPGLHHLYGTPDISLWLWRCLRGGTVDTAQRRGEANQMRTHSTHAVHAGHVQQWKQGKSLVCLVKKKKIPLYEHRFLSISWPAGMIELSGLTGAI